MDRQKSSDVSRANQDDGKKICWSCNKLSTFFKYYISTSVIKMWSILSVNIYFIKILADMRSHKKISLFTSVKISDRK